MSSKKPQPLITPEKPDRSCPVCGEISYSRAGIHPQCSVRQADAKRLNDIQRDKKDDKTKKPDNSARPWQKVCPKCKALQHVRKGACTCGHTFATRARAATDE